MKRRSMILLAFILLFTVCMAFVACNGKTIDKLESEDVVAEGKFAKGVTLSVSKTETTDQNYSTAISKVEGKNFDRSKVAVYDISLVKDDAKVQPDGKVKITMPAPFESPKGYVTYHLADGENAEELATTFTDGKITFETDGFSYFVIAGKTALPDNPNIPGKNFFAYADTNTQGSIKANGEAVGKGGYSAVLTAGTEVELEAVPFDGYEFVGWHKKAKVTGNNEYYEVSGSKAKFKYNGEEEMFVYARFDVVTYGITVNLNGGTLADGETIPETYDIETETITLPAPTKENATFAGWENADGESVTAITKGTTGEITLSAKWKAPTFVRVDKDKNPDENGEYVLFGSYPQSKVKSSSITGELAKKAGELPENGKNGKWTSFKYYYTVNVADGDPVASNEIDFMWYIDIEHNGEKYRGIYFTEFRPEISLSRDTGTLGRDPVGAFQYQNRYFGRTLYWFRYDPILWKIIKTDGEKTQLHCMSVLDTQPYCVLAEKSKEKTYTNKEKDKGYYEVFNVTPGVPKGIHATNYRYSNVRKWLNETFYQIAFDEDQKNRINDTYLDNESAGLGENTTDKAFLITYSEAMNLGSDKDAIRYASEYAICNGAGVNPYLGDSCDWYLRELYYGKRFSPDAKDSLYRYVGICGVSKDGRRKQSYAPYDPIEYGSTRTEDGVVPSVWVTLN